MPNDESVQERARLLFNRIPADLLDWIKTEEVLESIQKAVRESRTIIAEMENSRKVSYEELNRPICDSSMLTQCSSSPNNTVSV